MAATAFSSDTPLLITGIVRRRGIWGVWEVWALGLSSMLAVFVFARLWKRTGVMTEVELVERRYSGRAAAFLRGFKALTLPPLMRGVRHLRCGARHHLTQSSHRKRCQAPLRGSQTPQYHALD